eukprot:TRINITY_DN3321_c0_g1_i1.p1 TRINITY_DN3321_c0_g1~~TRINITY_DN3321_c0_g1_i1.p1  ORF type:complete len:195 (+),score=17.40 TRINITY_DN3321_c0_g1_i1:519-1103(+)
MFAFTMIMVENHFSIMRSKHRYLSCYDYAQTFCMVQLYRSTLYSCDRTFSMSGANVGKCYNNFPTTLSYEPVVNWVKEFEPKKNTMLRRDLVSKTLPTDNGNVSNRIQISCPLKDKCQSFTTYSYHGSFINHLKSAHDLKYGQISASNAPITDNKVNDSAKPSKKQKITPSSQHISANLMSQQLISTMFAVATQ